MVCCLSCSNPSKPLCICTFFVGVGLVQGDEAMPERLRNGEGDTLGEFLTSQTSDSSLDNRLAPQASCSLDDHCKMLTLEAASKRTFVLFLLLTSLNLTRQRFSCAGWLRTFQSISGLSRPPGITAVFLSIGIIFIITIMIMWTEWIVGTKYKYKTLNIYEAYQDPVRLCIFHK